MDDHALTSVRVARRLPAPPERVFDAWLDAAAVGRWLFATPTGEMVRVEVDPRVDGGFTIVEWRDGEDILHEGRWLELGRPRRIAFDFAVPRYSSQTSRVTVDIAPAEGGSELTLTHEMPEVPAEAARKTEEGWSGILTGLARELG